MWEGNGGNFFLVGNVCFATFYLVTLTQVSVPFLNYFWLFIVWAILIGTFIYLINIQM